MKMVGPGRAGTALLMLLAVAVQAEQWRFTDTTGILLMTPAFEKVRAFSEGRAAVKLSAGWGFIDRTGTMVIEPRFSQAGGFSEGLAPVRVNGLWGFIDTAGAMRIEPQFDSFDVFAWGVPGPFSSGRAKVCSLESHVIDSLGHSYRVERDDVESFGYIDRAGKKVISCRYHRAEGFSEGLAAVCTGMHIAPGAPIGSIDVEGGGRVILTVGGGMSGGEWGFIDTSGSLVIPSQYTAIRSFHHGRAALKQSVQNLEYGPNSFVWEDRTGYIDRSGKVAIPASLVYGGDFSEGLANVRIGYEVGPLGTLSRFGYIDTTGTVVIPAQFENAREFHDGRAAVWNTKLWGFIDRTGAIVIPMRLPECGNFSENRAAVRIGRKWGFIDVAGKTVIAPRYVEAGPFAEGFAAVRTK